VAGILERRHTLRRALTGGVVLGASAGLALGLVEVVYVLVTAGASFDGVLETGRFAALTAAALAGAGALVGLVEGLIAAAVESAAAALGDPRRDHLWRARLYTALAVPPVALVCAQIFRGPYARTIAHHDAYAVAIGVVALGILFVKLRVWQRIYDERIAPGSAWLVAALYALVGLVVYFADQRLLVRLYPFFHAGLGLIAFACIQLAVAMAALGTRRRLVRLLEPRNAALVGLVAVAAGAASLAAMGQKRALRSVVSERTVLAAPLLRVSGHAPLPRAGNLATVAEAPLPDGPHLGPVDVFVITIDAMRADRLAPRSAPTLTRLAQSGVVFDRAYAQVPHTSFSIATLLTGKPVFALSTLGLDAASHQTLPEVLKRERYKTAAFYPPSVFTIDGERLRAMAESRYGFEYVKYEHLDAGRRTDQIIHFLEEEKPARAFVWVHYFEPHEPYELHPGPFAGATEAVDRYDGEVHFADSEVARLLDYLRRTRPHALVIVAADHGEEFGEHGGRYHGTTLYEEQVHVPLVFATLDGSGLVPHRVAAPVGLVDVAPTILSLIGIVPSAKMRGRDLGPWLLPPATMAPADAHGPVFAEIDQKKTIIDGDHKLICDLATEACSAFDLAADPGERKNRIEDPFAGQLRARLDAWMTEESRFESSGADPRTQKILDRARMGDATVAKELAPLIADTSLRGEVVPLVAKLPPEPSTRAALEGVEDPALRPWADLALARLGDAAATKRLPAALARDCAGGAGHGDFCARAALAVGTVEALAGALERNDVDEPLQRALLAALGRSHDPRALDPLMVALANVRTRLDGVAALAALDDARALPTLLLWLPNEPYVPVRAAMASLVAELAKKSPAEARSVLLALAAVEHEPPVMAALLPALHALGAPAVVELGRAQPRTVAGGELWLVGTGSGTVEVGGAHVTMTDGVARLDTPRAGAAPLRARDGDATPRLAFSRPKP
jgi:arylsulfatase A-like enzyme